MLSFVQGWLTPRCNPIGIDFGSDVLRLAQVQWAGDEYKDRGGDQILIMREEDILAVIG